MRRHSNNIDSDRQLLIPAGHMCLEDAFKNKRVAYRTKDWRLITNLYMPVEVGRAQGIGHRAL